MSTQKQAELLLSLGCNLDTKHLSTREAASLIKRLMEKNTTIDTETLKSNTSLIDLAGRHTELRREISGDKATINCIGYQAKTVIVALAKLKLQSRDTSMSLLDFARQNFGVGASQSEA